MTNINTSQKKKIEELEQEVVNWKGEYEKEHEARLKLAEGIVSTPETVTPPAPENSAADTAATTGDENPAEGNGGETLTPEQEEEALRKELSGMKKDELIAFGTESGFDMAAIAEKTKAEIIEFLVASSKE